MEAIISSFLLILLLVQYFSQTWSQPTNPHCTPSACGDIHYISYPFRLKSDPKKCGDPRFEFACENNATILYLKSLKYYVKEIYYSKQNYDDDPIVRVVDASINKDDTCSFPTSSMYKDIYFSVREYPYRITTYSSPRYEPISQPINFISCPNPLKNSSLFTDITADCASIPSFNSSQYSNRYVYVKVGRMNASEVPHMCSSEMVVMASWLEFNDLKNASLSEIHQALLYGFNLTVCSFCTDDPFSKTFPSLSVDIFPFLAVIVGLSMAVISPPVMTIIGFAAMTLLVYIFLYHSSEILEIAGVLADNVKSPLFLLFIGELIIITPRIILFPFMLWLLIHKCRRRHRSTYNTIECFLQSDNKLVPIRYSYSQIKKMTRGFRHKLGEGGFGSVYKGKTRSGHHVAVKLLGKSGGNGQDFMNEIGTIGRIHHVNIVTLVGYCAQGSKRALVFDFMPNGSLDKYIFNRENSESLNWERKFEIAVGVARGIEYLHRGCDIQILHFDIKPHNILLDDKFVPKISDFGLAKFCSTEKKTMTMTAIRGTIGYVAPELINRGIGQVSYKADVYSFGMMLMELAGLNREMTKKDGESSKYFPYWIYNQFDQGTDIAFGSFDENDKSDAQKLVRKMTIVALWCIKMSPDDRPSMSEVLNMLEGDVERLKIPEYPSQSTYMTISEDESSLGTCSNASVSLAHHNVAMPSVEITIEE